jgi:D-alanyl-D-alanine dipeptidase
MTIYHYESIPIEESGEPLVDLAGYDFLLEPAYYNWGLSDSSKMYLRRTVAERLAAVRDQLSPLNFKIWDGWRPREVQHKIFMKYWKEMASEFPHWTDEQLRKQVGTFVTVATDPNKIPIHATGGSVDLTLVDEGDVELDMGTRFDYFGPEAAALYFEQEGENETVRKNRYILRRAMTEAEFRYDQDEWWHFDYGNQIWAAALDKPNAIYSEIKKDKPDTIQSRRWPYPLS